MRAIYFGEFDLFSGTFSQERHQVGHLARILKILCLAYDVVLVPPGSLLEHGAALPVFEELAPLVHARRLGTSADHSAGSPSNYFKDKIDQRMIPYGDRARTWAKVANDELQDRLLAVVPNDWAMRRNVPGQVESFHQLVLGELRAVGRNRFNNVARNLERQIKDLLDRGQQASRERIFLQIGSMRGEIRVDELSFATTLVQRAYFHAGTSAHVVGTQPGSACVLFPGGLRRAMTSQIKWGWSPHHFVVQFASGGIDAISSRARAIGINLEEIARFTPADLLKLVELRSWDSVSRFLCGDVPHSSTDELQNALHDGEITAAIKLAPSEWIAKRTQTLAPSIVMPAWGWAATALIGSGFCEGDPKIESSCIFDWARRIVSGGLADPIILPPTIAHLLTLIAVSGEVGLTIEEAIQAIRDVAHVGPDAAPALYPSAANYRTIDRQKLDRAALQATMFRNRLDVYKNKLSSTLKVFGIQIQAHEGRIRITNGTVRVVNTPWAPQGNNAAFELPATPKLAGLQLQVWQIMRVHFPNEVGIRTILDGIGTIGQSRSQVSKTVYRITRNLCRAKSRWRIYNDCVGNYRLLSLPPSEHE